MPEIVVESPNAPGKSVLRGRLRLHKEVFHSFHNEVGDEVWT